MSGTVCKLVVSTGPTARGRATQTARLRDRLVAAGRDVVLADFPRYGEPAAVLRRALSPRRVRHARATIDAYRASILYALDRFDASAGIRAALARGAIVVSNRYVSANKGHQMAKIADPEERRRFLAWVNDLEYGCSASRGPISRSCCTSPPTSGSSSWPGRTSAAYLAGETRDIHEDDREHLRAAEEAYLSLLTLDDAEHWRRLECVEDGALLSIDAVAERVWDLWRRCSTAHERVGFGELPLRSREAFSERELTRTVPALTIRPLSRRPCAKPS